MGYIVEQTGFFNLCEVMTNGQASLKLFHWHDRENAERRLESQTPKQWLEMLIPGSFMTAQKPKDRPGFELRETVELSLSRDGGFSRRWTSTLCNHLPELLSHPQPTHYRICVNGTDRLENKDYDQVLDLAQPRIPGFDRSHA